MNCGLIAVAMGITLSIIGNIKFLGTAQKHNRLGLNCDLHLQGGHLFKLGIRVATVQYPGERQRNFHRSRTSM